jgi:hypothetical protein
MSKITQERLNRLNQEQKRIDNVINQHNVDINKLNNMDKNLNLINKVNNTKKNLIETEKMLEQNEAGLKYINQKNKVIEDRKKFLKNLDSIYDEQKLDNCKKIKKINKDVSTKDELIQINNYHFAKKDKRTQVLVKFLLLAIFSTVVFYSYFLRILKFKTLLYIEGGLFLFFGILIIRDIYFVESKDAIQRVKNATQETARGLAKATAQNVLGLTEKDFQCPKRCSPKIKIVDIEDKKPSKYMNTKEIDEDLCN